MYTYSHIPIYTETYICNHTYYKSEFESSGQQKVIEETVAEETVALAERWTIS